MIAEIGGEGHQESGENVLYKTREYWWKMLLMSPVIETTILKTRKEVKDPRTELLVRIKLLETYWRSNQALRSSDAKSHVLFQNDRQEDRDGGRNGDDEAKAI